MIEESEIREYYLLFSYDLYPTSPRPPCTIPDDPEGKTFHKHVT